MERRDELIGQIREIRKHSYAIEWQKGHLRALVKELHKIDYAFDNLEIWNEDTEDCKNQPLTSNYEEIHPIYERQWEAFCDGWLFYEWDFEEESRLPIYMQGRRPLYLPKNRPKF